MATRQSYRLFLRSSFFALFLLSPPLDILRLDLNLGHFILLGRDWTLGLDPFLNGESGPVDAAWNLLWRGFLPLLAVLGGGLWIAWKYGRLYCGWLCPHFSVVETLNGLMRRASGRPTLWEKQRLPERQRDGSLVKPHPAYWLAVGAAVAGFSFLWALTLLTYLLTPAEIYHNLLNISLTRNQVIFLAVATGAFCIEFTFARHLFCRYGCAVGLFQSYAWMANDKALVVSFQGSRARACMDCPAACDDACPMRLKPRAIKRRMFACTQCTECISACEDVQKNNPQGSLLRWVRDLEAMSASGRPPER